MRSRLYVKDLTSPNSPLPNRCFFSFLALFGRLGAQGTICLKLSLASVLPVLLLLLLLVIFVLLKLVLFCWSHLCFVFLCFRFMWLFFALTWSGSCFSLMLCSLLMFFLLWVLILLLFLGILSFALLHPVGGMCRCVHEQSYNGIPCSVIKAEDKSRVFAVVVNFVFAPVPSIQLGLQPCSLNVHVYLSFKHVDGTCIGGMGGRGWGWNMTTGAGSVQR